MTMQTLNLPPGPAEGFDLGGSDESLARLRRYFAEFGDIYRVLDRKSTRLNSSHRP